MLKKSSDEMSAEWRLRLVAEKARVDLHKADRSSAEQVSATEGKILDAIAAISSKLVTRDEISKLVESGGASQQPGVSTEWANVVRKKSTHSSKNLAEVPGGNNLQEKQRRRARTLPLAVVVRRGDDSYPELLKNLRANVDPATTEEKISRLRETRNGGLLVEINGGAESKEAVRAAIEKSLGPGGSVRTLEQRSLVELRELDGVTTREDVVDAITRDHNIRAEELKVLNPSTTYGGGQAATLLIPREVATIILDKGHIRVGLVFCRARECGERLPRR